MTKKPHIDCYPWAVPTEAQKRMFDALSYEKQLQMVREALEEGETPRPSEMIDMDRLLQELKA